MPPPTGPVRPLRVLAVTRTNPARHLTWRLRVEALLPHLRAQGIEVESTRLPHDRAELMAYCREHRGYDVLWLHRLIFWPSELRHLQRIAALMVLDIDDPVGLSSSRPCNFALSRCLKFRATARRCSAILGASDGLVHLARKHNARTHLVPLCAEPDRYAQRPRRRQAGEPLRLLWLGGKSTFKYLERVRPHLEIIGRRCPGVTLTVVGHSALELTSLQVRNIPWSPDAEQEYLRNCHLGLVPMKSDRWTRAKAALKPLQYLASGMPFLGHPVGVNVRLADGGQNGVLADSPADWADAVNRLVADEETRLRMGNDGVRYVCRHHAPAVLAGQVAEVFRTLCGEKLIPRAA